MRARWAHDDRLRAMWATDMSQTEIARALGFKELPVYAQAMRLALPPRSGKANYMKAEAARRGISPHELQRRIVDVVARDHLCAAVLDDADGLP